MRMDAEVLSGYSKPRLAVVTSRFPYPLEKGDKLRLYHQLKGLSHHFSIVLLAIGEKGIEKNHVEQVRSVVDEIMATDNSRKRYVAGALGPTSQSASLSPDVNDPGFRKVNFEDLKSGYYEQLKGLVDGGVDIILIETG